MIGNTIQIVFERSSFDHNWIYGEPIQRKNYKDELETVYQVTGLVVDAFTDVSGSVEGENFLGFGEAKGNVSSDRMYKVQVIQRGKMTDTFIDVRAWRITKILTYAQQPQEDEKFKNLHTL